MAAIQHAGRRVQPARPTPRKRATASKSGAKSKASKTRTRRQTMQELLRMAAGLAVVFVLLPVGLSVAAPGLLKGVAPELAASPLNRIVLSPVGAIAPLFTPEVQRWGAHIERWAAAHGVDPNLLATVMQIESCGDHDVTSSAGAQGLFQVMPFHFSEGEVMTDPETNARRGAAFLAYCMDYADGDPFRALACYNGGPSVVRRDFATWPHETQRYYVWGSTIYEDAKRNQTRSGSLDAWLNAGGSGLCAIAARDT
jgi:soluble lytic murein transglycosylase-like protein